MSGLRCGDDVPGSLRAKSISHPARNERAPLRRDPAHRGTGLRGAGRHPARNERAPLRRGPQARSALRPLGHPARNERAPLRPSQHRPNPNRSVSHPARNERAPLRRGRTEAPSSKRWRGHPARNERAPLRRELPGRRRHPRLVIPLEMSGLRCGPPQRARRQGQHLGHPARNERAPLRLLDVLGEDLLRHQSSRSK